MGPRLRTFTALPLGGDNGFDRSICQARGWIDEVRLGRIGSFAEIAEREAQGERHIRLLAPLAFPSPRIVAAIVNGTAPADLTVTGLAKAQSYSWGEQERRVGL
jgi:site-specific DNA recombinase